MILKQSGLQHPDPLTHNERWLPEISLGLRIFQGLVRLGNFLRGAWGRRRL